MYVKMNLSFVSKQLASGHTYSAIARQLNVSRQAVHDFCKRHSLQKIWKEKEPSQYQKRKNSFPYPEHYADAKNRFRRKRQNCKQGKWEFSIEFEDLIWPTYCPILGIKLEYSSAFDQKVEGSLSFDRIDSSKGYIKGNVQIISWRANRIKNNGTAEEHRKIADYIDKTG